MTVRVEVFDNLAVYVDDYRITDRSTKWPASKMIASFTCKKSEVRAQLIERNHSDAAKKIDSEDY